MLDQNTDRMWYVIGAVLIGAAIIFGMNTLMPEAFASVSGNFDTVVESTTEFMADRGWYKGDVNANVLDPSSIFYEPTMENTHYDSDTNTFSMTANFAEQDSYGITRFMRIDGAKHYIPYGETFTVSYEIMSSIDLEIRNDVNVYPVDNEFKRILNPWNGNNSDLVSARRLNGLRPGNGVKDFLPRQPIKAGRWTKMTVTYSNTDPKNENGLSLEDVSGVSTFTKFDNPIEIKIRNLKGEFNNYATEFIPYGVNPEEVK